MKKKRRENKKTSQAGKVFLQKYHLSSLQRSLSLPRLISTMHQISWTNNWENKQIPNLLYQGRNDESLCVYFHLYEPVAKIKLSKYSGRVWLLSLPFCIQTKMICKTECLLCPTGPRYTYRKKGQSFFFFFFAFGR